MAATLDLTLDQVRRFRMERSGLIHPMESAESVARTLVGVQAQILPAAGLALWNRTTRLTNTRFEDLLFNRRSLVKLWGQRGTLHLYDSDDWPLLHGAHAGSRTWWERQAEQENHDMQTYHSRIEAVANALRERESMGRGDLKALELDLPEELYSPWGGIFADLVRRGFACHAGRMGNEGQFAHRERWLPNLEWNPPEPDAANIEFARRYFAAYGPALADDFAYWRGARLLLGRRWVAALGDELVEVRADGTPMLALRRDLDHLAALPDRSDTLPVRMLYRFDPLILAHRDKGWVADPNAYARIWITSGHINGIVLHRGKAVATWRYDRKGKGIVVIVSPFKPLPRAVTDRLMRHSEGVAHFFGVPLADVVTEPST
jgi:hypothetical protein